MPELPEVETTRRGLEPHLQGQRIRAMIVRDARLRWPVPSDLPGWVAGKRIERLIRRSKYLLVDCGEGWLILHLGMSGSLRVVPADLEPGAHDHVDLVLESGQALRLRDPRRFGAVLWTRAAIDTHPLLVHLGIEPLTRELHPARLHQLTRPHRTGIKQFLMDGRRIVGVGNIYANESLFLAGIHPRVPAGKLSLERCARLSSAIKQTLRAAIRAGGSSLRDFVGADGNAGYFQQRYWVYDRAGQPCRRCGSVIRKIQQGQRSTFYCPSCQK